MKRAQFSGTMKKRISKLLIANRGEIACRIIRTAKKLGIKTVAVYSDIDKNSLNVSMSDEAYRIGPASSQDSYLKQEKIIEVAKKTKCEAIHPGYGFLSENASFSEACNDSGIIFIGPPASAIRDMGIKSTSKNIMSEANVPVIPGYHGTDQSDSSLFSRAKQIGFPLMIKAVLGGGGKGMRIVHDENEFLTQLASARREALSAFGDESVLLERFVVAPRHVEVQVFADEHGDCVYLHERDCSVQRRHQKVIEEAPAPGITDAMREQLGSTAVQAAKAVNYVGAGTVEFIYDAIQKQFYFMEMNTRLQVEHPVTEMITNTDLVEWQIKVANGEQLPFLQDEIPLNGHAVEARIYAEDPYAGFLPNAGPLVYYSPPQISPSVRVETGVREGDEVSVHYDPMIAKLVVWGEDRKQAFAKLHDNLLKFNLVGVTSNVEFLASVCKNKDMLMENITTNFIDEHKEELLQKQVPSIEHIAQAALALILWEERNDLEFNDPNDPWITQRGFRVNHNYTRKLKLIFDSKELNVEVAYNKNGYSVKMDNKLFEIEGRISTDEDGRTWLMASTAESSWKTKIFMHEDNIHLFTEDGSYCFEVWKPKFNYEEEKEVISAVAPMPGVVNKVLVKIGQVVKEGEAVMIVIAMKMEHVIKSPRDGIIEEVNFAVGDSVPKNKPVIKLMEESK